MLRYCCVVINQLGKRKRELSSLCRAMHKHKHYHTRRIWSIWARMRTKLNENEKEKNNKRLLLYILLPYRFYTWNKHFWWWLRICVCAWESLCYVLFFYASRCCLFVHTRLIERVWCVYICMCFSRFIVEFYATDNIVKKQYSLYSFWIFMDPLPIEYHADNLYWVSY